MARAIVIGGGVGGLTAAAVLHQQGWAVTVLERSPALEPVGAGISLAPNAQRALDVVGLGDEIRALAAWQRDGGLRTPSGRWLSRTSSEAIAERFGGSLVLLHRATLVDVLRSRLPDGTVRTGLAARLADPGGPGRPATVTCDAGDLEAELVVGADGINSVVRKALFPGHPGPTYAGFTTWRVVVPAPERHFGSHETWGRGELWGSHLMKDGTAYAYAAAGVPAGWKAPGGERAELIRRFGHWHEPIPEILDSVTPEQILRHDVYYTRHALPAYHKGRVALLGDAAHAMTPSLGQGGNQAIEDAVVLAHHVDPDRDPGPALAAYSAERLPRTMGIVAKAYRMGRINTTPCGRTATLLRNALIAGVNKAGPNLVLRTLDGIMDWHPPQDPRAGAERTEASRPRS
ncbi:FAD-dependent monooxygenase [Streptomyces luteolus]|uniref:FAD-dependent monooxygenase n=1 Tax=Streptomyces luteolus TaxID=3043615 RepID=A0ABT6SUP0_9ACTN|nr:FAD-dependent monooxygenase [Streptomyces sp. B-S-A12]MDI3418362.1 FAD-dependent monooxygenase [Streptomyces sp. B-S-A12]